MLLLLPVAGHALSASEIFADGNRLFRDDLYWAALLRYRQAYEASKGKAAKGEVAKAKPRARK